MARPEIHESSINVLAEGAEIRGTLRVTDYSRIHGRLVGDLEGAPGSVVVLGESGLIEGKLDVDTVWIDGCVRGDIKATTRVSISGSGRVLGNIQTPSLVIEHGAHFEGANSSPVVAPSPT